MLGAGKTLGMVGLGRLESRVARYAAALSLVSLVIPMLTKPAFFPEPDLRSQRGQRGDPDHWSF